MGEQSDHEDLKEHRQCQAYPPLRKKTGGCDSRPLSLTTIWRHRLWPHLDVAGFGRDTTYRVAMLDRATVGTVVVLSVAADAAVSAL